MNREVLNQIKAELGWKPSPASDQPKPYDGVRLDGDIVYISGHVAKSGGELMYGGRIGRDVSIEDARKSAALAMINCLDLFDEAHGLENLTEILKVTGYLSCTEEITNHPYIMNAGSEVLRSVFGEKGRHARAAVGIHTLPHGASVEVELVAKHKVPQND